MAVSPVEFNSVDGVRNDIPPERFGKKDLASGINIDIDETGAITRRRGTAIKIAGAAHSIWSDGKVAYFVQGTTLKQLFPDMSTKTVQLNVTGRRLAYEVIGDKVYWSDGIQSGAIDRDGISRRWGISPPPTPQIALIPGSLAAGRYGVCVQYLRGDNQVSGSSAIEWCVTDGTQGIRVLLSPSLDADVDSQQVYLTTPDGDKPLRVVDAAANSVSLDVNGDLAYGMPISKQFKRPAPAGQIIGYAFGRAFVAVENFLFFSDSFFYELFDEKHGFLGFPSRITMFVALRDGIYLGFEDQTIFLQGTSPESWVVAARYPYGVVEGTAVTVRNELVQTGEIAPSVMWLSKKGVCIGLPGGQVKNLTGGRYIDAQPPSRGAGLLKFKDGTPHFVVTTTPN